MLFPTSPHTPFNIYVRIDYSAAPPAATPLTLQQCNFAVGQRHKLQP